MKLDISILRVSEDKLETVEMKETDIDNDFKDGEYEIIPVYLNSKDGIESEKRINYYEGGDERC